jgi:D-alanyl-D-alanine endopeptidase (penicillin-binding protein 7)
MTAMVFLEGNPDLSARTMLEDADWREGGVQHLPIKDSVLVRDLLRASLIASDNTATAAIARLSGKDFQAFVVRMNQKAFDLGMHQATFADETGLSPDNRATVADVAILLHAAMAVPIIREITNQPVAEIRMGSGRYFRMETTDELLESYLNQSPYRIVGGKTGYLPTAGYCLGTVVSDAQGHELIVVALGSETKADRFDDVKDLAAWAFKVFTWESLPTPVSYAP